MLRAGDPLHNVLFALPKPIAAFLFIGVAMLLVSFQTAAQGWFPQHPPPNSGWVLQAVDLVDSAHMWVIGNDGLILFSSNGGWQTTNQNSSPSLFLNDVRFLDTSCGWVVGEEFVFPSSFRGKIHSTTNGGQSWTDQSLGQSLPGLLALDCIDPQNGWACGFNGAVLHTTNGGLSWALDTVGAVTSQFNDIQFFNQQVGWLAEKRKLYKTTNAGETWVTISDTGASSVFILDSLRVWVTGGQIFGSRYGPIRKSTNGGLTWELQYEPLFEISPMKISFTDSLNGWCALWDQQQDPPPLSHRISMVHTTDGGSTWSEQYMGGIPMWGLSFDGADNGCAVGLGAIMYSSDRGINWIRRSNGIYTQLNAIAIVDSLDVWAVGAERTVLHTTDGGMRWFTMMSPGLGDLRCMSFVEKRHGWFGGNQTPIYFTTDGGASWQMSPTAGYPYLRGMVFTDTLLGWAVGDDIIHTSDGGITWFPQVAYAQLLAIDFVDPLYGWAVGLDGRVLATTNGGVNWFPQQSLTTNALNAVDFIDRSNGWVVGDWGRILRTTNGGSSWVTQISPTTAWLWGVRFANASLGWAVGDSGIILVTTNGGEIWNRQSTGTQDLFGVDIRYGMGWIVGSRGVILHAEGLVAVDQSGSNQPLGFELLQNYPNPFNPETNIEFSLTSRQRVRLTVFDILGRQIATLEDNVRPAGRHTVSWNRNGLSSGVYYYRLEVGGNTIATKRMVLLR